MLLKDFILDGRNRLREAGVECHDFLEHMQQICLDSWDWKYTDLWRRWQEEVSPEFLTLAESRLQKRLSGIPLQYIRGHEHFWKSRLEVGPGVLIPRRETECLVESLLRHCEEPLARVAELGPGTGNIGIAALTERPGWMWHAFEASTQAAPYLMRNVERELPIGRQYHVYVEDFFEAAPQLAPYDWVVSNPPYIPSIEVPYLSREVRHEPVEALDGGYDGLAYIRGLALFAREHAKQGLICELSPEQAASANALCLSLGYGFVDVEKDYAGRDRVLVAKRHTEWTL